MFWRIRVSKDFINEYWFENLNLRGSFKGTILKYVHDNYPIYYPSYEQIYLKGTEDEIIEMENAICTYCDTNKIIYSNYFHHKDVINNPQNKTLGKNHI